MTARLRQETGNAGPSSALTMVAEAPTTSPAASCNRATARLIVTHNMAKRPMPDRAALATLGSALSVIQADFLATHDCSAHDIRPIRWETARRWGDIGPAGLRAGTIRLTDVL